MEEKVLVEGQYNFRKVFDPIKEGRPEFEIDKSMQSLIYRANQKL